MVIIKNVVHFSKIHNCTIIADLYNLSHYLRCLYKVDYIFATM